MTCYILPEPAPKSSATVRKKEVKAVTSWDVLRNPGKHRWIGPACPGDYKSSALLKLAVPLLWHEWLAALGRMSLPLLHFGGIFVALNYSQDHTSH